jgi:hypothetical protein
LAECTSAPDASRKVWAPLRSAVMATFGFKAAGVEVDQADRTGRPATGAAEAAAEDATTVRKGAFYSWYHRKCSEAVESPFDVLYGTSKPAASYWFAVVLWLKLVINFLHSVGQSTELEWGVWVQLALGVTVCILVLVRPYISLDDERVDIAALLSLVGVLACSFTARAGEPLAPAYTAVAAVLAAAPIVTLLGLNLWAKRTAKKERAHLRCGAISDGPGPLARPKPAAAVTQPRTVALAHPVVAARRAGPAPASAAAVKVRKTPRWPGSWANIGLVEPCFHRSA